MIVCYSNQQAVKISGGQLIFYSEISNMEKIMKILGIREFLGCTKFLPLFMSWIFFASNIVFLVVLNKRDFNIYDDLG